MKVFYCAIAICLLAGLMAAPVDAICPCPRILDPVCGSNHVTYNNKCELNCVAKTVEGRSMGLQLYRTGRCEKEPRSFDFDLED